jgi:hypothetical protein
MKKKMQFCTDFILNKKRREGGVIPSFVIYFLRIMCAAMLNANAIIPTIPIGHCHISHRAGSGLISRLPPPPVKFMF